MYITLKDFCVHHRIEESFVLNLKEYELVQLRKINGRSHLYSDELPKLERIIRLHNELNINVEGIQAIQHLLERVAELQEELKIVKRKLGRLEQY